jgi:hypothetical protein
VVLLLGLQEQQQVMPSPLLLLLLVLEGCCVLILMQLVLGLGCVWWCRQGQQLAGALRRATRLKRCVCFCRLVSVLAATYDAAA